MQPRRRDTGSGAFLLKLLRRVSSPSDETRFTDEYWQQLVREFRWHQVIAEFLCVIGLAGGFLIPFALTRSFQSWDIGVGFGLSVFLPLAYVGLLCAASGFGSKYERWADFSTMMYAIPWRVQLRWLYLPLIVIGLICLCGREILPHKIGRTAPPSEMGVK